MVTPMLICTFVFSYANKRFSHDMAQFYKIKHLVIMALLGRIFFKLGIFTVHICMVCVYFCSLGSLP